MQIIAQATVNADDKPRLAHASSAVVTAVLMPSGAHAFK
jgi:hypothetical protein